MKRPNLPNGGLRLSHAEDGLSQFDPPRTLPARKSVALGDEVDSRLSGPKDNIMKLHANWGHAPAQQLNGVLVDSDRELMGSINVAEESPQQREVCCAYDKAPRRPIAGASRASSFSEKPHADLLFSEDAIASRAMDMYSKHSLPIPARSAVGFLPSIPSLRRRGMPSAVDGFRLSAGRNTIGWTGGAHRGGNPAGFLVGASRRGPVSVAGCAPLAR